MKLSIFEVRNYKMYPPLILKLNRWFNNALLSFMFSNQFVITCAIFQKQLESYNVVHKQINLGHVGHVRKIKK